MTIKLHDKKTAVQLYSVSRLNTILSKFEHVRKCHNPGGDGYSAKCPVHGGESTSSISFAVKDDGRILMKCWGQCSFNEIVDETGLDPSDFFPERLTHHAPPEQRRKWKQDALHRDWAEFSQDFILECRVIWVAGKQVRNGQPLNDEENTRLDLAMKRISNIGDLFNGIT
jgi:hypothetical protein